MTGEIFAALAGMFAAAFLAATPFPAQSEIVFLALMAGEKVPVWLLVLVASLGNTLGSCVTYLVGRGVGGMRGARWFPLSPAQLARAEGWFHRWGLWILLLSWAPGGDLVVAVAGALRVPFPLFLLLVGIAKTGRYIAVALIASGVAATLN